VFMLEVVAAAVTAVPGEIMHGSSSVSVTMKLLRYIPLVGSVAEVSCFLLPWMSPRVKSHNGLAGLGDDGAIDIMSFLKASPWIKLLLTTGISVLSGRHGFHVELRA
jgi:hypothetical protein